MRLILLIGCLSDLVAGSSGQNLWAMDTPPDPAVIEEQLLDFAQWAEAHHLIHGDLRPWNVFFDQHYGVQMIDWRDLSAFVDDLLPRDGQPPRRSDLLGEGHYAKFHPDLVTQAKFTEIDRSDARLIGKLLRGEIGISEAWLGPHPHSFPRWCKS
jgi:Phosphotransferase enzyme family